MRVFLIDLSTEPTECAELLHNGHPRRCAAQSLSKAELPVRCLLSSHHSFVQTTTTGLQAMPRLVGTRILKPASLQKISSGPSNNILSHSNMLRQGWSRLRRSNHRTMHWRAHSYN